MARAYLQLLSTAEDMQAFFKMFILEACMSDQLLVTGGEGSFGLKEPLLNGFISAHVENKLRASLKMTKLKHFFLAR